jgi:oxygen-independent coproporphyrinogen-3 oxidase
LLGLRERYVAALADEIALAGRQAILPDGSPRRCRTIFFGGGTPSLLTADQVATLLSAARAAFAVDEDAEVTLEANPGTLEYGQLDEVRATGVNRLSMGAQSFDAGLLRWMGRIHTPEEIERAVAAARAADFTSINLDFIYALPGQSMQTWEATLERALALRPEHLSLYSLIVEESTPLFTWVRQGRVRPVDDDVAADMYERAAERLTVAGYGQYEVSNWALPGHRCRHNLTYWHNLPYIGLGAGAHGWFGGCRYSEARPVRTYCERVEAAVAGQQDASDDERSMLPAAAVVERERISAELERAETGILGLRLVEGLDLAAFVRRFGVEFDAVFGERLRDVWAAGLLERAGDSLRLTERGRLLGNEVFACLLPENDSAS